MPDTTTPQPAVLPAHPAMFAALAVPNFRRYVSGQALSLIGTWVETVAQALLVLRLTHSGVILGLTTAARYAPILLLSPYAGLLVDRYAKRRVLLATQAGLGLVSAALGAAVLTGDIRLWQVVVLAVLFGIISAVDNPARQAFVQEVVGRDLVRNAVTLNTTLVNVARVVGPTVAAVLASTVGLGWCFVVNAVSFGFVIVSLLSLDTRRMHPVPPVPRGRGQLRAGLRYAARVPEIARPLLIMARLSSSSPRATPLSSSPPILSTAAGSPRCGRWPWSAPRRSAHRSSARYPTWPARGTPSASAPPPASPPSSSAAGPPMAVARTTGAGHPSNRSRRNHE